jgi:methanogenic corrinoid protein MtbC1
MIGRLGPRFASRGRTKGTVVIAMPAGERHDLGLAILGDILRSDGYRVLNLGADTPADALIAALRDVDDLVAIALSVVNGESLTTAATMIEAVRETLGAVPVLAGGAAVGDEQTALRLGADGWAGDAREVGKLIATMTATRRRTP